MARQRSVSARLRRQIRDRAGHLSEYCRTPQDLSPSALEVDHVVPRSMQGETELENLCLACRTCNGAKQAPSEARDFRTGRLVPLFHPRLQRWDEHFAWSDDFTRILGITPIGCVTVEALDMNSERMLLLRKLWVMMEVFPHDD